MSRAFVGEWIFSHALFDWTPQHDERYLAEVLLKPPSWLGRNSDAAARPRRCARASSRRATRRRAFVDWCADRVVDARPRDRRLHQRLPAAPRLAGAREADQGAAAGHLHRDGRRQLRSDDGRGDRAPVSVRRRRRVGRGATTSSPSWRCASSTATADRRSARRRHPGDASRPLPAGRPRRRRRRSPTSTRCPIPTTATSSISSSAAASARDWQPSVFVETSRGCWWGERMHCTFCGLNGATMAYRSKSAPRALAELTHLADVVSRAATSRWSTTSST